MDLEKSTIIILALAALVDDDWFLFQVLLLQMTNDELYFSNDIATDESIVGNTAKRRLL